MPSFETHYIRCYHFNCGLKKYKAFLDTYNCYNVAIFKEKDKIFDHNIITRLIMNSNELSDEKIKQEFIKWKREKRKWLTKN